VYYYAVSPVPPSKACHNGAINYPSCSACPSGQTWGNGTCYSNCTDGAVNPPSCSGFPLCSNGAKNPPYCTTGTPNKTSGNSNGTTGSFCLAFNFGDAEYSQNSTGWYLTLYIQNYCSDRSLTLSRVNVNGTILPGPWTLPAGYAPSPPLYSGPPPTDIVICMSCAGEVFVPCAIYWITVVVTGSGTSSGATTTQTRGEGWECR
jgi:hypothetical protein